MATLAPITDRSAVRAGWSKALTTPAAVAIIAAATILFRLPTFGPEQIDWDEWSFILMGADVAHGHLPFVHQFDLKPPLIFLLFGAVIAAFGKSLLAIRLLGAACVVLTATFVYLTGRRWTGDWPGLAGALICAALASAPFGWSTSTELPAIVFLSGAVLCLARQPLATSHAALAGLLTALAVLTRTNLALVALSLGLLLLGAALTRRREVAGKAWLAFGLAGAIPPALLVLVYAAAGELTTLRLAMIDVPLAYSGQLSVAQVARAHAMQLYYTAQGAPFLYGPPLLLAGIGVVRAIGWMARSQARWPLAVLTVATAATGGSLLIGGAAYPHYWLQLMPFIGLFAALGLAALGSRGLVPGVLATLLTLVPLVGATQASLTAVRPASADIARAAAHVRAQGEAEPQVWALHKHLILWYLDAPQLSRAGVHPDNLARRAIIDTLAQHGYVGADEVGRLMALRPRFVATDGGGKGLAWVRADGKPVDAWLASNYRLDARYGDVLIYRRD